MSTEEIAPSEREELWCTVTRALTFEARRWALIVIAENEVCSSDLARILGYDRASMHKHLKPLKETGVIAEITQKDRKPLRITGRTTVTRTRQSVQIAVRITPSFETQLRFELRESIAKRFDGWARLYPAPIQTDPQNHPEIETYRPSSTRSPASPPDQESG